MLIITDIKIREVEGDYHKILCIDPRSAILYKNEDNVVAKAPAFTIQEEIVKGTHICKRYGTYSEVGVYSPSRKDIDISLACTSKAKKIFNLWFNNLESLTAQLENKEIINEDLRKQLAEIQACKAIPMWRTLLTALIAKIKNTLRRKEE